MQGRAEIGVLFDAWVVPALTVGTGLERRSIDFVARGTVQDAGTLDGRSGSGRYTDRPAWACR